MSNKPKEQDTMRETAEAQPAYARDHDAPIPSPEKRMHELQVHQIELEIQNEALRQALNAMEESRDHYVKLHEFAPVGYLSLTCEGRIGEINLAGATMLRVERKNLEHYHFATFVATEDRGRWQRHFINLLTRDDTLACELTLHDDGSRIDVQLDCLCLKNEGKDRLVRIVMTDITERVQRDNLLRKSETTFRSLFENMLNGSAYCQMMFENGKPNDFVYLMVNKSFENLTGLKDVVGKKVSQVIPGIQISNPELFEIYGRVASTRQPEKFETYLPSLDAWFWVSVYSPEQGYFVATFDNISVRKRREEELIQSKSELEELYNAAPCGYHSLDSDSRILRINQTEADWLGYTQDELIGRQILEVMTPDSRLKFLNDFPRFKEDSYIKDVEYELVRKNGSTFPILSSSMAIYYSDGNFVMSRSSIFDLSESKWKDAELIVSEERFRQLFEKAPIAISLQNEYQILDANAALCRMFGYTLEELSDMTVTDMTHPDYIELTNKMVNEVLTGKLPYYSTEKKYVRKNGEIFWGHAVATEISGPNPQMRYIMGMVQDITERVSREELRMTEVREQRDVLVREVHHRIKNNLQGVAGLLQTHADLHPELAGVIEAAIGRIYSIANIHGLQANTLTEEINLEGLIGSIVETFGCHVEFINEQPHPVLLSREVAVPIALVLNELLTNAFKHHSGNSPVTIQSNIIGADTIITIVNNYDLCRFEAAKGGYGLKLVKSLLPRKSATMTVVQADNIYQVELKLSPPVTINIVTDKK